MRKNLGATTGNWYIIRFSVQDMHRFMIKFDNDVELLNGSDFASDIKNSFARVHNKNYPNWFEVINNRVELHGERQKKCLSVSIGWYGIVFDRLIKWQHSFESPAESLVNNFAESLVQILTRR